MALVVAWSMWGARLVCRIVGGAVGAAAAGAVFEPQVPFAAHLAIAAALGCVVWPIMHALGIWPLGIDPPRYARELRAIVERDRARRRFASEASEAAPTTAPQ